MKILHTADWHLGHYLRGQENNRFDEHEYFLRWLLDMIESHSIDLLIVAGDIFDSTNPPHWAEEQYYRFLAEVRQTHCKNVLIIGGNHDSPNNLNAPKQILNFLDIHVIGKASEVPEDEIIIINNKKSSIQLVVGAVPFLRDSDIRRSVNAENIMETERRIKEGILQHYAQIAHLVKKYKEEGIPVIATGHLYAAKSHTSDSEKEIHIGNQGQIDAERLPPIFDYIALGHIHRPQKVAGLNHIRYSGSPIPLSFSEYTDHKQVIIIEVDEKGLTDLQEIPIPLMRPLLSFKGTIDDVSKQILDYKKMTTLSPWAEVKINTKEYEYNIHERIQAFGKQVGLDILKVSIEHDKTGVQNDTIPTNLQSLHELTPLQVFKQKCENEQVNLEEDKYKEVLEAFQSLLEEVDEDNITDLS
jgi:exonuclease SbcD